MSEKLATRIVRILFDAGFTAYFAGGYVRDLLLGIPSSEIDIATSAPPEKIISLFPKTILVGVSFGVVVVILEGINFEVATFRKDHPYVDGRHPEGVDFSTPEHDASRRDFTINGMFYDPLTKTLHDYVEGQSDLKKGIIRAIGNPQERFTEDRLRMLRAVRFSARFGFSIEKQTEKAIVEHASELTPSVSIERIWQELSKMSHYKSFGHALLTLHRLQLLGNIFSDLKNCPHQLIEKRVAPFPFFPEKTPLIVYLIELFENMNLESRIALCQFLKITKRDCQLAEFFYHSEELFTSNTAQKVDWAHFYAHPDSSLFLEIEGAKMESAKKQDFFAEHAKKREELQVAIKRIEEKKPLITAALLQQHGILPSKAMGLLLKEAEALNVNDNLDQQEILERLKKHPLWT